jgi:UDP-N-acetylglucosamine 2-epimerase (non-hydrolysing)
MKMAPLVRAFAARRDLPTAMLVHTGQHYDVEMNARLFADLEMPSPDINLEVGSATHAVQTAEIMRRFEPVLDDIHPSCIIVVGDVNSTLACSLVATKKGVPVVHVEAGLRSFDRDMPEEINRVPTDQIADLLYTTEKVADNLAREGIPPDRIHFVGNVMIDSLPHHQRAVSPVDTLARRGTDFLAGRAVLGSSRFTGRQMSTRGCTARIARHPARCRNGFPVWPIHPRTRQHRAAGTVGFPTMLHRIAAAAVSEDARSLAMRG